MLTLARSTAICLLFVSLIQYSVARGQSADNTATENNSPASTDVDTMYGEKVLPVSEGPLLNPIHRFEDQPWFEISNLRPGDSLGEALAMDFAYEGQTTEPIHVVVLTNGKRHRFPVKPDLLAQHRGVIKCLFSDIEDKSEFGKDIEAYIELTDGEPSHAAAVRTGISGRVPVVPIADPLYFKVSKSAVRGEVEALTYSREMRQTEQKIYDSRKKRLGPPPPPPQGSQLADATTTLIPGTPVLAAFEGDWLKAEVLVVQPDGKLAVHWPQFGHPGNRMLERSYVAIAEETIEKLQQDPNAYSPSVELPIGSLQPPPPDYVVVPNNLKLLPGTPLKSVWGGGLWNYLLVRDDADTLAVINERAFGHEESYARRQLMIHKDVVKQLGAADAEKTFANRLKEAQAKSLASRNPIYSVGGRTRQYPIDIPLPEGYVIVTKETPLEVGTLCSASWGRRWSLVTIKALRENGDVEIHWNGWSTIEPVSRDSLIIAKSTLAELAAKAKPPSKDESAPAKTAEPKEESQDPQERFALYLEAVGAKKLPAMKLVQELTNVDLATAKEVLDSLPIELKRGLSKAEADMWKTRFEESGTKVRLEIVKPQRSE